MLVRHIASNAEALPVPYNTMSSQLVLMEVPTVHSGSSKGLSEDGPKEDRDCEAVSAPLSFFSNMLSFILVFGDSSMPIDFRRPRI